MTKTAAERIRVAILLGAPLTEQNFERTGIPYLSARFEVIVFDCVPWLGRDTDGEKRGNVLWKNGASIRSERDLELAIEEYQPGYAIDFVGLGSYTGRIQKILAKSKVKFVVQKLGNLPVPNVGDRTRALFFDRKVMAKQEPDIDLPQTSHLERSEGMPYARARHSVSRVVGKMKELIDIGRNALPPDISLLAGDKSLDRFTKEASQIIWVGSNDFHYYNEVKRGLNTGALSDAKEPFILFIDDGLPCANDWRILNVTPPVTADAYYPALRSFFERIESRHGLPVIIAGHPNSKSDDRFSSELGGRTVIFGETAALALQSTLVLVHGSTAISFAVLARKPMLFLMTRELDQSRYGVHVRNMAKILGRPLVYMDDAEDAAFSPRALAFDEKKYKRYETDYLQNELSSETQPWQAFIAHVLSKASAAS